MYSTVQTSTAVVHSRAAFKVPQMQVQDFVTGAQLTTVRPSNPSTEGQLNNSSLEITLGQIAVVQPEYFRGTAR